METARSKYYACRYNESASKSTNSLTLEYVEFDGRNETLHEIIGRKEIRKGDIDRVIEYDCLFPERQSERVHYAIEESSGHVKCRGDRCGQNGTIEKGGIYVKHNLREKYCVQFAVSHKCLNCFKIPRLLWMSFLRIEGYRDGPNSTVVNDEKSQFFRSLLEGTSEFVLAGYNELSRENKEKVVKKCVNPENWARCIAFKNKDVTQQFIDLFWHHDGDLAKWIDSNAQVGRMVIVKDSLKPKINGKTLKVMEYNTKKRMYVVKFDGVRYDLSSDKFLRASIEEAQKPPLQPREIIKNGSTVIINFAGGLNGKKAKVLRYDNEERKYTVCLLIDTKKEICLKANLIRLDEAPQQQKSQTTAQVVAQKDKETQQEGATTRKNKAPAASMSMLDQLKSSAKKKKY